MDAAATAWDRNVAVDAGAFAQKAVRQKRHREGRAWRPQTEPQTEPARQPIPGAANDQLWRASA